MADALIDGFGRRISYVRLSVTDRCDFRCRYCMSERMTFVPSDRLLSFDEVEALVDLLIERRVTKVRLTGGEPLVRRGIFKLIERLGSRLGVPVKRWTFAIDGDSTVKAAIHSEVNMDTHADSALAALRP